MSVQLLQQLQQAQKAAPSVDPVQVIRDKRNIPDAYQLQQPQSVSAPQGATSMTQLAQMMGNNQVPTGYFQQAAPQRWKPSAMAGLNSGAWLQQYLERVGQP